VSQHPDALNITLVAPALWQPRMDQALNAIAPGSRQTMAAIISALHGRHVGVTPEIAAALAALLIEAGAQGRARAPWDAVLERLRRELRTIPSAAGAAPVTAPATLHPRVDGFVLSSSPTYTILRLALPLVAKACQRVGASMLFCADPVPNGPSDADYHSYADHLSKAISEIAQAEAEQPFWIELALTMASREHGTTAARHAPLAAVDPIGMSYLLWFRPMPQVNDSSLPRPMLAPRKRQRSRRLREGGITGYRLTTRLEDLGGMVLSELLNPEEILLDRILNTGYLSVERPPRHQRQRDVLVIGMLPRAVRDAPGAEFIKSCWFDTMWRYAHFLRRQGLHRSEIRWIEGDGPDRARTVVYRIEDIQSSPVDPNLSDGERWMFLKALRWIPSFFNRRDRYENVSPPANATAAGDERDQVPPELRWCRHTWAAQRARQTAQRQDIDEYAHVHVMVMLPPATLPTPSVPAGDDDTAQALAEIWQYLALSMGLDKLSAGHLAATWVPAQVNTLADWKMITNRTHVLSFEREGVEPNHASVARELEEIWLDHLIEELYRG
jgi:hypothetical protein